MLRSMTGFGRCFVENARVGQQWEIKSVNGRYLDLKWRLPPIARYLEPVLEKTVRRHAARGRVEISLSLQFAPGQAPKPAFDMQQAGAMLDAVARLADTRGDTYTPDYTPFLSLGSLWSEPGVDEVDDLGRMLEQGLALALEDWNESRVSEGKQLALDLESRVARMLEWTAVLAEAAPRVREERVQLLRERLGETLAGLGHELEDDRFLQEIVILADKLDVSEELTRLGAHLERIQQLLRDGHDTGRKLDFTLQECFREINTCGNKAQDAELSRIVVDFKNELEKCREQAQNLE